MKNSDILIIVEGYSKEDIVNISYEIVKKEGLEGLNARKIASKLNSSVQPIFHNFKNMEEVEILVKEKIFKEYKTIISEATDKEKPYLAKGMAYIKFAKDYPEFFKILFMNNEKLTPEKFLERDEESSKNVLESGKKVFDLSIKEQKEVYLKSWIFAHGIACLVITKTIKYDEKRLKETLGSAVRQIVYGLKNNIK